MSKIMKKFGFLSVLILTLALMLTGCSDGNNGADGPGGAAGATGAAGADGVSLYKASNKNITFNALTVSNVGGYPTADFTITDGTAPVTGVTTSLLRFYLTELTPGTTAHDSDQWNQWIQERNSTGYAFGTFTDLGAGKYKYTFKTPFTSAPTQANTQRLIVRIRGLAGFNSVNGDYDFKIAAPGTKLASAKDIVTSEACNDCHGANINNFGHGGGYTGTKTCVICHSSAYTYVNDNGDTVTMAASGFDFTTMIHQIHSKINATTVFPASIDAKDWSAVAYPGSVLDCNKCHKGTKGDNWNTMPTRAACKSCHTTIKFDGSAYTGIKAGVGELHDMATDNTCYACHDAAYITDKHPRNADFDATKRTLKATITNATVSATTGNVTVTFTLKDGNTPITDRALFGNPSFSLVQLKPEANGANSHWVSYTGRFTTKNTAMAPVLQGRTESSANPATATANAVVVNGDGTFSYTFKLATATPEGDIRNVTHAHNAATVAGNYNKDTGLAQWLATYEIPNVVTYDPKLTHRVAMNVALAAPGDTKNASNAWLDFVPDGVTPIVTRSIVTMADCAKCHAGQKLHAGYEIEYCVTCHNQSTFDPFTGETVTLENMVHKIHMGAKLPSVIAGGTYKVNGTHDYSAMVFPQPITNCLSCHNETNADGANWRTKSTTGACITCHNSAGSVSHGAQNSVFGQSCTVCHNPGRTYPVQESHYGI